MEFIEDKKQYWKDYYFENSIEIKSKRSTNIKNSGLNKARRAKYRASKMINKVKDNEEIKNFYKNCPLGHHVDHIIPLQGIYAKGMHTIKNLQYLLAEDNIRKKNKFEPFVEIICNEEIVETFTY